MPSLTSFLTQPNQPNHWAVKIGLIAKMSIADKIFNGQDSQKQN